MRALTLAVNRLIERFDGVMAHFTAIDSDYVRLRDQIRDHETRLDRLEFPPDDKKGERSALFPVVKG